MNKFYIVTFNNAHEAMQAEEVCLKEKVRVTMMPTPTYITKSCGISLKIDENALIQIKSLIQIEKIKYKGVFMFEDNKAVEINVKEQG